MMTGIVGFLATGLIVYERIRDIEVAEEGSGPEGQKETRKDEADLKETSRTEFGQ